MSLLAQHWGRLDFLNTHGTLVLTWAIVVLVGFAFIATQPVNKTLRSSAATNKYKSNFFWWLGYTCGCVAAGSVAAVGAVATIFVLVYGVPIVGTLALLNILGGAWRGLGGLLGMPFQLAFGLMGVAFAPLHIVWAITRVRL